MRAALALVLLALLGVAACGQDKARSARQGDRTAYPAPVPGDGGLQLEFAWDIEKGMTLGWSSPATARDAVKASILRVARERLRGLGFDPLGASLRSGRLLVALPPADKSTEDLVVAALAARGLLELRIEVWPDAWHLARSERHDEAPPTRLGMWADPSAGSFEAFVLAEMARWQRARDAERRYVPSDPRYRLVQEAGTAGSQRGHFHVVEVAHPPSVFGGRTFENARISRIFYGNPMILYDVRADLQEPLRKWTDRHLGLPLAFLVDGHYVCAPIIQAALSRSVEGRLTSTGGAASKREARVFAAASTSGPLPCPMHLVRRSRRTKP